MYRSTPSDEFHVLMSSRRIGREKRVSFFFTIREALLHLGPCKSVKRVIHGTMGGRKWGGLHNGRRWKAGVQPHQSTGQDNAFLTLRLFGLLHPFPHRPSLNRARNPRRSARTQFRPANTNSSHPPTLSQTHHSEQS
jgi:hypothetical protein